MFSRVLGFIVPYSGSLRAKIETLEPGHSIVTLKDRRRVRNHLNSIHAIALCNLGELATGMAILNGLPNGARGILKKIEIEYFKKSRGVLTAECHCSPPENTSEQEYRIAAEIKDQSGDVTALAHATWLIGPETKKHGN
jgi:acyl-coenzyme A thioesterase PaaI-like protein